MRIKRVLRTIALASVGIALATISARAQVSSFDVSLNTSSLSGTTQVLAFSLTNNDGAADNTLTLSGFNFGGGSAIGGTEDCTLGGTFSGIGCSGNLTSGVSLTDSDFEEFFTQEFNVGSSLSFGLNTTNAFAGGIPDGFAMYLCDPTLSTCYSDDADTLAMLVLPLGGGTLSPASFTVDGAVAQGLPAPEVTSVTPEPGTFLLTTIAVCAILFRRNHRKGIAT